jgi:hypothetical protein
MNPYPSMAFFLGRLETGISAIESDTQVVQRLDLVVTDATSKKKRERHATTPFSSIGLHWVASCNTLGRPI